MEKKMQYRMEVDGLRAMAVLSLIFYHANLKLFASCFVGFNAFFMICGYLISGIIPMDQIASP